MARQTYLLCLEIEVDHAVNTPPVQWGCWSSFGDMALTAKVVSSQSRPPTVSLLSCMSIEEAMKLSAKHTDKDTAWQELVKLGEIVEAIKLHRSIYGSGLKEAKDFIDAYRATL